jgi:tetratricopeptide (TPR) repeat protein
MNKIVFLFIILNLFQHLSFAKKQGPALIDSLLIELPKAKEDSNKVNVLNNLSDKYRLIGEYDKSLQCGNDGLALAQKINYKHGIALSYDKIGIIYAQQGNYVKALNFFFASLKIRQKIVDKKGIADSYNNIGNVYWHQGNFDKALENHFASLKIRKEIGDKNGIATSCNNIGIIYDMKGNYDKALENHFASLKIRKEIGDKNGIALTYNNIGAIYDMKGNYDKALENHFASLKITQEIGDKNGIALSYNNIGIIYKKLGNYDKALENHFASLKITQKIGDKKGIANCYNNIGINYREKGNYDKALEFYFTSLKIRKEIEDKYGIAISYNNIGAIYGEKGNYEKALENYLASLKIRQEIGDKKGIATSYNNIGINYLKQHKIKEAKDQHLLTLAIAKQIGAKDDIRLAYLCLAQCDSASRNWKGAYEYHKLYKEFNDSIFNEESEKKTSQMSALYESEKKDGEIKLLNKDREKQAAVSAEESKRQRTILFSVIGGLLLVVVFSVFMFNRWRITKQQKNIIEEQKIVVEHQKEIVEEKNKEITDSITYALRIQTAILPPQKIVKQYLDDSFILYKPKDIVAGDFYWMETALSSEGGELILFAACDCTGHGVPGAMVSVVCHNALNRAVREFGLREPAAILDKTAEIVIENFSKSEEEIKDGMDISLCAYNSKTKTMQWAGANNPLWLLRNGELIETKADKQPIGMNEDSKPFTNHTFNLNTTDTIYLFTDGFADQFGGETGQKKLTRKRFKDLILTIQSKTLQEQGIALDKFITEYRKEIEQIDDILVMGVKV